MTPNTLCNLISLPVELARKLQNVDTGLVDTGLTKEQTEYFTRALRDKDAFKDASKRLEELIPTDKNGCKKLLVFLTSACGTYDAYREKGIPENIFIDTLKCFTRFSIEHKESYGEYGFDRCGWVGRQLSLQLFRLGELEYELASLEGQRAISLHIPSDADISDEKTNESLTRAKIFFKTYFPEYFGVPYFCFSWLLSPALENMLTPSSRIAQFRKHFHVTKWEKDAEDYIQWVYKNPKLAPEEFPEHTSLQRNIKKHVLSGGYIGAGFGFLKGL